MSIAYIPQGTTDPRQLVFGINQALERLQPFTSQNNGTVNIGQTGPTQNGLVNLGQIAGDQAIPTLYVVKSEDITGIDTEGAQNAAISVLVEATNTSHVGGGAPITQANGIKSEVHQNGTGGAVSFFGIAEGGSDINGAFGAFLQAVANNYPGGAIGVGADIYNNGGTDMPWSAFVPGTSSATLGLDLSAQGANLCTAAVEIRAGASQWDVGFGAYGNAVKTALINDGSNSISVLVSTGSHTNGIDFSAATFSGNAIALPAWTPFVPTVTASGGSITTYTSTGRYTKIGKTVTFNMTITIVTSGTGNGNIIATLPVNPLSNTVCFGRENAVTGNMLQGYIVAGGSANIFTYNNQYPGAGGYVLAVAGTYEST